MFKAQIWKSSIRYSNYVNVNTVFGCTGHSSPVPGQSCTWAQHELLGVYGFILSLFTTGMCICCKNTMESLVKNSNIYLTWYKTDGIWTFAESNLVCNHILDTPSHPAVPCTLYTQKPLIITLCTHIHTSKQISWIYKYFLFIAFYMCESLSF